MPAPARKATGPAFTQQANSAPEGLEAAVEAVKSRGYTVAEPSSYHPSQTLQVLIGTRSGTQDGYDEQAFFFEDGRYLGTDTSQPSASIKVIGQSDTEVTLAYALYQPGDGSCCAKGGQAAVRFQLNNGRLQALDPIPPASSSSAPSRR